MSSIIIIIKMAHAADHFYTVTLGVVVLQSTAEKDSHSGRIRWKCYR